MVTQAQPISAPLLDGAGPAVTLASLLAAGPVVLVFFKVSCPTCQLALPFFERLHRQSTGLQVIGVSQDQADPSRLFVERYQLTFPILLDQAAERFPASNAFRLTHVPSIFVVEPDGAISHAWTGFSRADFEKLATRAAATPIFRDDDHVPAWKAG